jgi:hypothetical protein
MALGRVLSFGVRRLHARIVKPKPNTIVHTLSDPINKVENALSEHQVSFDHEHKNADEPTFPSNP